MNKFKEFQQAFVKHLRRLLQLIVGKNDDEYTSVLLDEAKNDEERRVFGEILQENSLEHQLMEELAQSGMDPGEWLEQQVEETVRDVCPDANTEDMERIHDAIEQGFVDDIANEARDLQQDCSLTATEVLETQQSEIDDSEQTDETQAERKEEGL